MKFKFDSISIKKSKKQIYIWQGDGWGSNHKGYLAWMYRPARMTLVEGFKNLVEEKYIDERVKFYKWDIIKPNSIFIWIGAYHVLNSFTIITWLFSFGYWIKIRAYFYFIWSVLLNCGVFIHFYLC